MEVALLPSPPLTMGPFRGSALGAGRVHMAHRREDAMSSTGDPPVGEREGLEITLREFLDEDDALSVVQLMLAAGWRHPSESARAWTDLCTAMTRLAGAWLEVEGALAAYRATKSEKVWGPERMRHDPERAR